MCLMPEDRKTKYSDMFRQWLDKAATADDWVYQVELPPGTQNMHAQCYLKTKARERPNEVYDNLRDYLLKEYKVSQVTTMINVSAASQQGRTALQNYAMKPDTRLLGPFGKRGIYTGSDLPTDDQLYPWQKLVEELIMDYPPDGRTVNFVYDPKGDNGKSYFIKRMFHKHKIPFIFRSPIRDMQCLVAKHRHKRAYLFDLCRTAPSGTSSKNAYALVEQLVCGMCYTEKYDSDVWIQNPAHIWFFMNEAPDLGALSQDRYRLWGIRDRKLVALLPSELPKPKKHRLTSEEVLESLGVYKRPRVDTSNLTAPVAPPIPVQGPLDFFFAPISTSLEQQIAL